MIRIGVIGLGFGKNVHIPAFQRDPRCEIKAISSRNLESLKKVASDLNISKYYQRYEDLISDPEIDAISIAVPPTEQPRILRLAIEAGKHIFFEKPLGGGLAQALNILKLKNLNNLAHVIDFEFPELFLWKKTKQMLSENHIGEVSQVLVSWNIETVTHKTNPESWKIKTDQGGGTLNNFVSHVFYYLEWMLGPITNLMCDLHKDDQLVFLNLNFKSGACGSVSVSTNSPFGNGHRIELFGKKGRLTLDNSSADYMKEFVLSGKDKKSNFREESPEKNSSLDGRIETVSQLTTRFLDWVETGIPQCPNMTNAARVEYLIEKARESDLKKSWQETTEFTVK